MTCHPEDQLSAYIDDELNHDEKKQVEAHLETCESCQTLMEDLLVMQSDIMQAFQCTQVPADLEIRVLQSIGREKIPAVAGKGWLLVPLLALLTLGIIWFTTGAVVVKVIHGSLKLMIAMIYLTSHFISSVPVLSGLTVALSFIILSASIYSLRRLFQTTTS